MKTNSSNDPKETTVVSPTVQKKPRARKSPEPKPEPKMSIEEMVFEIKSHVGVLQNAMVVEQERMKSIESLTNRTSATLSSMLKSRSLNNDLYDLRVLVNGSVQQFFTDHAREIIQEVTKPIVKEIAKINKNVMSYSKGLDDIRKDLKTITEYIYAMNGSCIPCDQKGDEDE